MNNHIKKSTFTLAEVFSPHPSGIRKSAFTLAEVLITLGIIGVVAALTIPTLIANYQKNQCVNQLKSTYSKLYNAITMAQNDYGDPSGWLYFDENLIGSDNSWNFANTYLAPYLKKSNIYRSSKLKNCKDAVYKLPDGSIKTCNSVIGFCGTCSSAESNNMTQIYLADGSIIVPLVRKTGDVVNGFYTDQVEIDIDINGYKGPNVWGKDVFRLQMGSMTGYKLMGFSTSNQSRDSALRQCKIGYIFNCAGVIMMDGWQIKDDYPW